MGLEALLRNSRDPDSFYLSQDHRREDPSGATRTVGLPSRGSGNSRAQAVKLKHTLGSRPHERPLLNPSPSQPTRPHGPSQPLPFPGSDTAPVPSLTAVQGQDHAIPKVARLTVEPQARSTGPSLPPTPERPALPYPAENGPAGTEGLWPPARRGRLRCHVIHAPGTPFPGLKQMPCPPRQEGRGRRKSGTKIQWRRRNQEEL